MATLPHTYYLLIHVLFHLCYQCLIVNVRNSSDLVNRILQFFADPHDFGYLGDFCFLENSQINILLIFLLCVFFNSITIHHHYPSGEFEQLLQPLDLHAFHWPPFSWPLAPFPLLLLPLFKIATRMWSQRQQEKQLLHVCPESQKLQPEEFHTTIHSMKEEGQPRSTWSVSQWVGWIGFSMYMYVWT